LRLFVQSPRAQLKAVDKRAPIEVSGWSDLKLSSNWGPPDDDEVLTNG